MRLTQAVGFNAGTSSLGHADGSSLSHVGIALRRFMDRWAVRRRYRRDARQLDGFSDRELWDLGLSRSDVQAIGEGIYRRD